jgi:hypothetical protein
MFKFGVDTFIWSENFGEKDLWILDKSKELGFKPWILLLLTRRVFQPMP